MTAQTKPTKIIHPKVEGHSRPSSPANSNNIYSCAVLAVTYTNLPNSHFVIIVICGLVCVPLCSKPETQISLNLGSLFSGLCEGESMGEAELNKVETQVPEHVTPAVSETQAPPASTKDVIEEKAVVPHVADKVDDSKALAAVEKVPESSEHKSGGSKDRDVQLTRIETEKRLSLIRAWEESEKSKAENKAQKTKASILSWENTKVASLENKLKKIEEELEKKKAEYKEIMQNKIAMIHKEAEEKNAMVEAKRGEELLKAEETAAKYRAKNSKPEKFLGCFGTKSI